MRFFFYGTLVAGSCNAVAVALHRKLTGGVPATVRGWLHAVPDAAGWYPALRPDRDGVPVAGMVYCAGPDFTLADLAALDAYEACRPDDPEGSEYLRRTVPARTADGEVKAEAYICHAPLPPGALAIPDGNFRAFLKGTGLPEYSGA